MITRVKDLIEQLSTLNPESVVLYAYDEYQRTGVHGHISSDISVVLDSDDQFVINEDDEVVYFCNEDIDDLLDETTELITKHQNVQPAIMLFAS